MASNFSQDEQTPKQLTEAELKDRQNNFLEFWNGTLKVKPKCIVFDLDYTLWPFFVDQHLTPPFTTQTTTKSNKIKTVIHDHRNKLIEPYPEVNAILETLDRYRKSNTQAPKLYLAIASRSSTPNDSAKVMELLGWTKYFESIQIYPTGKQKHLTEIKNELGIKSFKEMLFFDDTLSSIKAASQLNVPAHKLNRTDGLTFKELVGGLSLYAKSS